LQIPLAGVFANGKPVAGKITYKMLLRHKRQANLQLAINGMRQNTNNITQTGFYIFCKKKCISS
jgi:hypothetical protein